MNDNNLDRFKKTFSYKSLTLTHDLQEVGFWNVRGEDANADMGGSHYMPDLGTYEGKLEDVLAYAVLLPRFWTWGGGGDITKVEVIKIDSSSSPKLIEAQKKVKDLEEELRKAKLALSYKNA
jgi:hypothetical protein